MKTLEIDALIAEHIMGYDVDMSVFRIPSYKTEEGVTINFHPTLDIRDAFKVINKIQEDGYAWSMQMINLENEVEVQVGTGYTSDKSIPIAISLAALRHYRVDFKDFA